MRGQNAFRPITSSAGKKVAWASSAATMPTASTGPSPCSGGRIVTLSSIAGLTAMAGISRGYGVSKAGIIQLTRQAAVACADRGGGHRYQHGAPLPVRENRSS